MKDLDIFFNVTEKWFLMTLIMLDDVILFSEQNTLCIKTLNFLYNFFYVSAWIWKFI